MSGSEVRRARDAMQGLLSEWTLDDDGAVVDAYARAVWSAIAEPGDVDASRAIGRYGAWSALCRVRDADPDDVAERRAFARWRGRMPGAEGGLDRARRAGVRLTLPGDVAWPGRVDDLGETAPYCLWVRGAPHLLAWPGALVAIVGARAATAYGEHVATEVAAELSSQGVGIVSGAAYGIDGMAHRASLAAGGFTIAVLAGGVDQDYPSGHRDLLARIEAVGLIVSDVPCGASPTKHRFLARNRLIAALSDATVVVEAGWRSGSLNTANHAATMGRPVGAVPGPITSASSVGCHRLLREYAAQCITGASDVLELIGRDGGSAAAVEQEDAVTRRIRRALDTARWRTLEELAAEGACDLRRADACLALIELGGDAERGPRGWRALR